MSESKHTPGPWVVVTPQTRTHIKTPDGRYVLEAHYGARNIHDARLIAAAPDLLAELKEILEWALVEKAPLREQELASIRRVITKAGA